MSTTVGRLSWSIALVALISIIGAMLFSFPQGTNSALADMMRWLHIGLAILWLTTTATVSGVVLPIARARNGTHNTRFNMLITRYATLVAVIVSFIVASGIVLTFGVLSDGSITGLWFALLSVKVLISVLIAYVVLRQRSVGTGNSVGIKGGLTRLLGYDVLLAFGVLLLLATSLLRFV